MPDGSLMADDAHLGSAGQQARYQQEHAKLKLPRLFKNRPTHPSKSMDKGGRSKDR
eukprot:COSAG02_NODE_825_length_16730_cov_58.738260_19_plen_55_part_01